MFFKDLLEWNFCENVIRIILVYPIGRWHFLILSLLFFLLFLSSCYRNLFILRYTKVTFLFLNLFFFFLSGGNVFLFWNLFTTKFLVLLCVVKDAFLHRNIFLLLSCKKQRERAYEILKACSRNYRNRALIQSRIITKFLFTRNLLLLKFFNFSLHVVTVIDLYFNHLLDGDFL